MIYESMNLCMRDSEGSEVKCCHTTSNFYGSSCQLVGGWKFFEDSNRDLYKGPLASGSQLGIRLTGAPKQDRS